MPYSLLLLIYTLLSFWLVSHCYFPISLLSVFLYHILVGTLIRKIYSIFYIHPRHFSWNLNSFMLDNDHTYKWIDFIILFTLHILLFFFLLFSFLKWFFPIFIFLFSFQSYNNIVQYFFIGYQEYFNCISVKLINILTLSIFISNHHHLS